MATSVTMFICEKLCEQIITDQKRENSIIIVKGANDCMTSEDLQHARETIQSSHVVVCQLEINLDITREALQMARAANVKTIFNPAPAVKSLPDAFLANTYVLCCNETEAEILTASTVTNDAECEAAIRCLLTKGPQWVVLTLGAKGAKFGEKGVDLIQHINPPCNDPRPVVDTTGAGDCFVGTLSYLLARYPDLPMNTVIERAVTIASISVRAAGTQTSYPSKSDLPPDLI